MLLRVRRSQPKPDTNQPQAAIAFAVSWCADLCLHVFSSCRLWLNPHARTHSSTQQVRRVRLYRCVWVGDGFNVTSIRSPSIAPTCINTAYIKDQSGLSFTLCCVRRGEIWLQHRSSATYNRIQKKQHSTSDHLIWAMSLQKPWRQK